MSPSSSAWRAVTVQQMQRIDETAMHTYGIPRLLLMEHAGQAVARTARRYLPTPPQSVLICCGPGYNGGDGLCAAWHLAQSGHAPRVLLVGSDDRLKDEPAVYAKIVRSLGVPVRELATSSDLASVQEWFAEGRLIIDALLGIGLEGPVRPLYASVIAAINRTGTPAIAVDIPSGLDGDTGLAHGTAVRAAATVTFGLPKHGLLVWDGPAHTGELIVDDIGIPTPLLKLS